MSDQGERGPTGDTGQQGDQGIIGDPGHAGPQGRPGLTGERGPHGDHGQTGDTGDPGQRGQQGRPGNSLSRWQTLIIFALVVVAFAGGLYRTELQQRQININTAKIVETNHQGCLAGVAYIQRLNEQYDALIAIETSLRDDPDATELGIRVAKARINAYTKFKTPIPPNACR